MPNMNINPMQLPVPQSPIDLRSQIAQQIAAGIKEQAAPKPPEQPQPPNSISSVYQASPFGKMADIGKGLTNDSMSGLRKAWDWITTDTPNPTVMDSTFQGGLPDPLQLALASVTGRYGGGAMQTGMDGQPITIEGMDRQISPEQLQAVADANKDFVKRRKILEQMYGEGKTMKDSTKNWLTGGGGLLVGLLASAMGIPLPAVLGLAGAGAVEARKAADKGTKDFNLEAANAYGQLGEERLKSAQLLNNMLGLDMKPMAVAGGMAFPSREGNTIRWKIINTQTPKSMQDQQRNLRYGMSQAIKLAQDPSRAINELSGMQIPQGEGKPNIRVDEIIRQMLNNLNQQAGDMGDQGMVNAIHQYTSGMGFKKGDLNAARLLNAIKSNPFVNQALTQLYQQYIMMGMGVGPMPTGVDTSQ